MELKRLLLVASICSPPVLATPRPAAPGSTFILAPRAAVVDWNTPRDNGSLFLAARPGTHSAAWFNSRKKKSWPRRDTFAGGTATPSPERRNTPGNWQGLAGPNSMVSFPTAVSWGAGREDVFYHDRDGNVCSHFSYDGFAWSSEENLSGSFDSSIVVSSWSIGRIDAYGKGTDGSCWHNSYDKSSSFSSSVSWAGWTSLGGNMVYEPSTVTWGSGRSDVFAISASTAEVWHRSYSSVSWGSWENLGGNIGEAPHSCSWGSGHMSLFVKGTDGQCWHRMWLTSQGGWSNWQSLGGTLAGKVASVAWGSRIDIFVRGTDNHCWHRRYHGDLNSWEEWEDLGGNLAYAPTVVQYQSTLEVYAVHIDKSMYRRVYSGGSWSSSWQSFGGTLASQASAVVWNTNNVSVYAMGTDFSCQRNF